MAENKVTFGATSKGKQSVIHKQYEFVKHREYANGTVQWRCKLYQKNRCQARLTTKGDVIVSDCDPDHNHCGNKESALARLAVNEMKEKMNKLSANSNAVIRSVSTQLTPDVLMALPKKPTLKKVLQRKRRRLQAETDFTILPPSLTDTTFSMPPQFQHMTLSDSGSVENRLIMLEQFSSNMESSKGPLHNKIVLVTGASSGIGEATAKALAKRGVKVCIAARRQDKLASIRKDIEKEGGVAFQYELDVTDRLEFEKTTKHIESIIGPIDILINNAGVMFYTRMQNAMVSDWDRTIDVNCRGVTNGIACVLPGMVQRKSGHIVNMSSDAGRRGFPGLAVYSGTKFFVEGMSQGLRHEVKDQGIRVTCIQPGDCATEISNYNVDKDAEKEYGTAGGGKILNPEDVANAIVYAVTQPPHVAVNEVLVEPRQIPI